MFSILFLTVGCVPLQDIKPVALEVTQGLADKVKEMDDFINHIDEAILLDADSALEFCKSPEAKDDEMSKLNCPQCATSIKIGINNAKKRRAKVHDAFMSLQDTISNMQGTGVVRLITEMTYRKRSLNPKADIEAFYDEFMLDITSIRHNCWNPVIEKNILKLGIKGGASILPIPKMF